MAALMQAVPDLIMRATDRDYPPILHLPHALVSVAGYRSWRAAEGEPRHWLCDLLVSFYTHSQGGGAGAKTLLQGGSPVNYITRWDYSHYHLLAYVLTYWSPRDVVYKALASPMHPLRLSCVALDTVDTVTTTCALVDLGVRLHPKNRLLPAMVGVVLYNSGAFFRWLDRLGRGKETGSFLQTPPRSSVTRGAALAVMYYYLGHLHRGGKRRNSSVIALTVAVVCLELLENILGFDGFARLHEPVHAVLKALQSTFQLGPQPAKPIQA